jgi:hypothetical protein
MLDGYESPIELKVRMTIGDGEITVDYAGSSQRRRAASTRRSATPTRIRCSG